MLGAMQAQAVDFKNNFRGIAVSRQQSAIRIQTTIPAVGFQSTSAYSGQWANEDITPMLNSDGSVNDEAYGVGSTGHRGHIRRADNNGDGYYDVTGLPVNPIVDPNDPGNVPLGDGLWVLLALALGYAGARRKRILEP